MARPPSIAGSRPVVVATRFTESEAKQLDAMRGALSRAEWLRLLQKREVKRLTGESV